VQQICSYPDRKPGVGSQLEAQQTAVRYRAPVPAQPRTAGIVALDGVGSPASRVVPLAGPFRAASRCVRISGMTCSVRPGRDLQPHSQLARRTSLAAGEAAVTVTLPCDLLVDRDGHLAPRGLGGGRSTIVGLGTERDCVPLSGGNAVVVAGATGLGTNRQLHLLRPPRPHTSCRMRACEFTGRRLCGIAGLPRCRPPAAQQPEPAGW
jgi:hypothetical protein